MFFRRMNKSLVSLCGPRMNLFKRAQKETRKQKQQKQTNLIELKPFDEFQMMTDKIISLKRNDIFLRLLLVRHLIN